MTNAEKTVLKVALKRTEMLRKTLRRAFWLPPPLADEKEFGPAYHSREWFGRDVTDADRVAYQRAITKLANRGLLETYREWGTRLTNVRLTRRGMKVAKELE